MTYRMDTDEVMSLYTKYEKAGGWDQLMDWWQVVLFSENELAIQHAMANDANQEEYA